MKRGRRGTKARGLARPCERSSAKVARYAPAVPSRLKNTVIGGHVERLMEADLLVDTPHFFEAAAEGSARFAVHAAWRHNRADASRLAGALHERG